MIILVINNKAYHYEIIETVIHKYYKILNINKQISPPHIFLEMPENIEYSTYIKDKYPNVTINEHKFFGYDFLINCSVYGIEYEMVKSNVSHNHHYICHDVSADMKKIPNVHFVTPLNNNNYIYCDVLPFCKEPKIKNDIPTYIIQGELSAYRRDFKLLSKILEGTYEFPFKFIIIGKGPPCPELIDLYALYKDKVEIKCDLGFLDYHRMFLSCYCVFPCISEERNSMYYRNKLTSTINYARAYNLPILLDSRMQYIYNCKNAYVYKNDDKLCKYFNKSLEHFYKKSIFNCLRH